MQKRVCPAMALLSPDCWDCTATIKSLEQIDGQTVRRLNRLGICVGCPISAVKRPSADPIIFLINNSRIALRKSEAEKLLIEVESCLK